MSNLKAVCLVTLFSLVSCDVDIQAEHFIHKRASTNVNCDGGSFILCEGKITNANPTPKTIEEEAMAKKSSKLYKAYTAMIKSPDYSSLLSKGAKLGLSTDETQAVRLYTKDSIGLYNELNTALREGNDVYPVLHFRLQTALSKLPKSTSVLFRGYNKTVNVDDGTTLRLPGYTSTSQNINVAKVFSSPGCTLMRFDTSKQGGSVSELSEFPGESEIIIPPTEKFDVYKTTFEDPYHYIYLRPSRVNKRSTSVFTLCNSSNLNTYSPLLLVLVAVKRFCSM